MAVVRDGARLGDVGAAIEELARREGCGVVREFGGHGIGRRMHHGPARRPHGIRAARARACARGWPHDRADDHTRRPAIRTLADGWTIVTARRQLSSAQFEHTLVVTRDGCEVLTA
jgi:methionyl aminopeptidase